MKLKKLILQGFKSFADRTEFEFLDGLVAINSCDHIRRLYDNWQRQLPMEFLEFLVLPRQTGPDQIAYWAEEIRKLDGSMR